MKTFFKVLGIGALALVVYEYGITVGMNSIIDQVSADECRRLLKNRRVGVQVRSLRPDLVAKEREYETEQRRTAESIFSLFSRRSANADGTDDTAARELLEAIRSGRINLVIEKPTGAAGTA